MQHVRFPLMDLTYIKTTVVGKLLHDNVDPMVRHLIDEAIEYHEHPHKRDRIYGCRTWPRTGTTKFVSLKHMDEHPNPVQVFEVLSKRVEDVSKAPNRRDYDVVVENCNLFAISGQSLDEPFENLATVDVYNPKANTWQTIEPMLMKRSNFAATAVNGIVYVSGGFHIVFLDKLEAYNTLTRKWKLLSNMPQSRAYHQLVAIGDRLYAIGNVMEGRGKTMDSYDIATNKWTEEPPMSTSRYAFGAAVLNNMIYVCGGHSDYYGTEVFDPVQRVWTAIASTHNARSQFSLVVYQDKLWAFGGMNSEQTIEVYDPETNVWTNFKAKIYANLGGMLTEVSNF